MKQSNFVENLNRFSINDYSKHIDWMLRIRDADLRHDFYSFSYTRRSFVFIFVLALSLTCIYTPFEIIFIRNIIEVQHNLYFPIINLVNLFILNISTWFYVIAKVYKGSLLDKYDQINSIIFMASVTILAIIRIYRYPAIPCNLNLISEIILSRECIDKHILSWDTGLYLTVPQGLFIIVIKDTRFWLSCLSFFSIFIAIVALSIKFHPRYVGLLVFWGPLIYFFLREIFLQRVGNYFLNRKIVETLVNNENNQAENHANEMRHMIANVAHDLKTPLSSFISGVEIIEQVLFECEDSHKDGSLTLETCYDKFHSIGQFLEDIRNTNSFMLMTINRCIDYTKASKGMKLVPKYETIDLIETLTLPLNCMRNIQSRITICLQPIPQNICSHIITDKQWLQENILCLLSNAVKYSSGGEVMITVSMQFTHNKTYDNNHTNAPGEMKLKLIDTDKANHTRPGSSSVHEDDSKSKRSVKSIRSISGNIREMMFQLHISSKSNRVNPAVNINVKTSINPYPNSTNGSSTRSSRLPTNVENDNDLEESTSIRSELDDDLNVPHLLFEIEDTGIGMSDEAMSLLFNPFKQNQRLAGGTGLGLYSLAKRVEALNGQYGVKRRKDKRQGSLFWFTIPYKADEIMASLAVLDNSSVRSSQKIENITSTSTKVNYPIRLPNQPVKPIDISSVVQPFYHHDSPKNTLSLRTPRAAYLKIKQQQGQGQALNILLVDDSPAILKMTTMMLRKCGHKIETAENGAIAVQMCEDRWDHEDMIYDLILMDLQMPVMDGLEATRRIRANETKDENRFCRPKQIIVGCSANSDAETTEEAMRAGLDHFMSKPFTIDSFQETVNKILPVGGITSSPPNQNMQIYDI